jgi:hypothetical protein
MFLLAPRRLYNLRRVFSREDFLGYVLAASVLLGGYAAAAPYS